MVRFHPHALVVLDTNSDLLEKIKFSLLSDGISAPSRFGGTELLSAEKFLEFSESKKILLDSKILI